MLLLFQGGAAPQQYTITAEAGSLVITGTAAVLEVGRKVAVLSGSFAETGQAASFIADRLLTAGVEAFAVTGSAAGLSKGRTLLAESVVFLAGGGAAFLGSARLLQAIPSSYQADGAAAGLLVGRALLAETGAFEVDAYAEAYVVVTGGASVSGGKGADSSTKQKKKSIFKPTGLPPYKETVERLVEETREIHQEVRREILSLPKPPKPIKQTSLSEIDAEIGSLLSKKLRTEDEEIVLMLLVAVAGLRA